jgi:hypothetical protein
MCSDRGNNPVTLCLEIEKTKTVRPKVCTSEQSHVIQIEGRTGGASITPFSNDYDLFFLFIEGQTQEGPSLPQLRSGDNRFALLGSVR